MTRAVWATLAVIMLGGCSGAPSTPTSPTAPATASPPATAQTRIISLSGNLAFANVTVGSSKTATLTITNSGNSVLTVSAINVSGGMGSVLAGDWLSGAVAPGRSQLVTIQFAPSAAQVYSGTLAVTSDATSGSNTIAVSGAGVSVTATAVPGYYLWGGAGYSQYLGFFTCIFCVEFSADSVNNQFGQYGSQFSSTSIRNGFSQYGSQFSTYSACNQFASSPPRVYNSSRTVYYGELTLNQVRIDAIRLSSIVSWLTTSVCGR